MQRLWQDIRYSLRIMRKKPAFTIFAVLTLALGIGVNTVVFSVANAILLRPLPVTDPDGLIRIYQRTAEGAVQSRFSYPDYKDLLNRSSSLDGIAAVSLNPFRLDAVDQSQQILGESISGNYFKVLGIEAFKGRTISAQDDAPGSRAVALISHQFWTQRFADDPAITGKTIRLNGSVHDVIGVMDSNFNGTFAGARIDVWVPLLSSESTMMSAWQNDRAKPAVQLLGRLKENVSIEQADAELVAIYSQLEKAYPDTNRGKRLFTAPATLLHGNLRKGATIFFAAVMALMGVVLFIACSNIASLLVTRAMERRREMAIRISLGANRKQLMLQLLTESLLFAFLGGLAGLAVAVWASKLIVTFWPVPTIPIHFDFGPDTTSLSLLFRSESAHGTFAWTHSHAAKQS